MVDILGWNEREINLKHHFDKLQRFNLSLQKFDLATNEFLISFLKQSVIAWTDWIFIIDCFEAAFDWSNYVNYFDNKEPIWNPS